MTPGTDRAPAALRAAGLVTRLRELGGDDVRDAGDVVRSRWRVDAADRHRVGEVVRVAQAACAAVERVVASGRRALVLGGDCTVTVGVVAGLARAGRSPALLYVDGGPD